MMTATCEECGKEFTESECLGRVSAGTKLIHHKPFCMSSSNTSSEKVKKC